MIHPPCRMTLTKFMSFISSSYKSVASDLILYSIEPKILLYPSAWIMLVFLFFSFESYKSEESFLTDASYLSDCNYFEFSETMHIIFSLINNYRSSYTLSSIFSVLIAWNTFLRLIFSLVCSRLTTGLLVLSSCLIS